jgi:hypothetical protein
MADCLAACLIVSFFIVVLRLDVSVGMKGAWHKLAPIVAVENIIDGAVACRVPRFTVLRDAPVALAISG